ncbi:MAG: FAD binding domain-containing protein [Rhodospirillales bacterium]|nr:FAD binding domain-containing protein [Rhodospirillales bacterium]MDE0380691.1 FAD binding domain-containing protein [Rhodospirillales bacterium]
MKPPPFDYFCPETLEEALALLAEHGEAAKVIAGGQSLVPMLNLRALHPAVLIDINRLSGLDHVSLEGGQLRVGALARHKAVLESAAVADASPLMALAYPYVSHGPIRNRGTLCGNLCHNDPASEMPAVAVASDAEMVLQSTGGTRTVGAEDFFTGTLETAAEANELLVEVRVPQAPAGQGAGFHEVSARKGDFAYVAVGATLELAEGACAAARIVCAGVGDGPHRARAAEEALAGAAPGDEAFGQAAAAAADSIDPGEDFHADADYRRDLVRSLTRRALADAASRCN